MHEALGTIPSSSKPHKMVPSYVSFLHPWPKGAGTLKGMESEIGISAMG